MSDLAVRQESIIESVVIGGDLSKLTADQRVSYYKAVCDSIGLNPLTRPFDYITLNGKLTLYARKDAADQLRKIHGVSIDDVEITEVGDTYSVKVKAHDAAGRSDVEIGVVSKKDMQGNSANVQMKAVTKAKRRVTLSLCGLGMLDETEIETIPNAQIAVVDDTGEIKPEPEKQPEDEPTTEPEKITPTEYWKEVRIIQKHDEAWGKALLEKNGGDFEAAYYEAKKLRAK